MVSNQELVRNRIVQFYRNNIQHGKNYICHHFKKEGISKSTIYQILKTYEVRKSSKRKVGSGRKAKIFSPKKTKKLLRKFDNNDKMSQRKFARLIGCSQSYISKKLKKLGCKKYKKIKSPEYNTRQEKAVKSSCRWMYKNYQNLEFVLDDEKYFTLSGTHCPGNDIFYSRNKKLTPWEKKLKFKRKYEPKILFYIVASERGISKPYFRKSKLAINQKIYEEDCLTKILQPFLSKYYPENNYIFWPDKASSHYARKTILHLTNNCINYVPYCRNPTNLPQCRPIEDFFGSLAQLVYEKGWKAQNINQLEQRIKTCLRKMDFESVQRNFSAIRTKLRKTFEHGPYFTNH